MQCVDRNSLYCEFVLDYNEWEGNNRFQAYKGCIKDDGGNERDAFSMELIILGKVYLRHGW